MMRDVSQLEQDFLKGFSILATESPKFRRMAYAAMADAQFHKKREAVPSRNLYLIPLYPGRLP